MRALCLYSWARWTAIAFLALVSIGTSARAQTRPNPCDDISSSPDDVSLQLSLNNGRTVYREGEIVALQLSFTSSTADKYHLTTRNYDRSGRLNIDSLCLDSASARDPLSDYFESSLFGFLGGGLSGDHVLSQSPYTIRVELNEWKAVRPGIYRLRVLSHRVAKTGDQPEAMNATVLLWSNSVEFQVVAADADWQAEQLQGAVRTLDSAGESNEEAKHAARLLRFLGSEAATRELARRYWADNDQPYGWDFKFGLVGSPHRQIALQAMKAAIADPQHPITREFVNLLTLLEMESRPEHRLPPYDEKNKEAWSRLRDAKTAAYNKMVAEHLDELAAVLDTKAGQARAVSVNTLLMENSAGGIAARTRLRQLLVASWDSLPARTRNELIQYRWDEIGGPELLPILRRIVNSPPNLGHTTDKPERGPALRHIYELSYSEGRDLVLREILEQKGDISIKVLAILPDRELPQVDVLVRAKSSAGNDGDFYYELIDRYASERVLVPLKEEYEQHRGKWACAPQSALLRYFLRVDSKYGSAQIADALTHRNHTGCYKVVFSGLGEQLHIPAVERLAISALDDASVEVVRDAAESLAKFGSARAESALWQRLEKFHETWKEKGEQLRYRPGASQEQLMLSGLEGVLISAIEVGHAWLCGPDKLQHLVELVVTAQERNRVQSALQEWQKREFGLNLSWWPDGGLDYSVGYFSGKGMKSLKEKLAQFPAGIRFVSIMTKAEHERHRDEIAEVENAASAAGLLLEMELPR